MKSYLVAFAFLGVAFLGIGLVPKAAAECQSACCDYGNDGLEIDCLSGDERCLIWDGTIPDIVGRGCFVWDPVACHTAIYCLD